MLAGSPFRSAIGSLLIELGVHGGCEGKLFDFSAADVEELVMQGDDPSLNVEKPLFSLSVIACYVLQTLAQHSAVDAQEWEELAGEVAMLVHLASRSAEEEASQPMVRSLVVGLFDLYETLTQCEGDGYIARQLSFKYEKGLKHLLARDWEEQLQRLKNRLASDVMGLVLYERLKGHKK